MGIPTINLGKPRLVLHCHGCVMPIVLPRRSRLGKYDNPLHPPKENWTITLVCPQTERASVYSALEVELYPVQMPDHMTNLWEIVNRDDLELSGEPKVAYAHTGGRDPRRIVLEVLGWADSPSIIFRNLEW